MEENYKSEHERITALEEQMAHVADQLSYLSSTPASTSAPGTIYTELGYSQMPTLNVCLPRLGATQIAHAQQIFQLAATIGMEKLPNHFHQKLGVWHAIFAANTNCAAWSKEWDRIIDEAKNMVDQGAQRVKQFVSNQVTKAGFPKWARDIVMEGIDLLTGLGEDELNAGLELARISGKLGLWLRCRSPF